MKTALEQAIDAAAQEIHEWWDSGDRIVAMYMNRRDDSRNPEITKRIAAIIRKHLGLHCFS